MECSWALVVRHPCIGCTSRWWGMGRKDASEMEIERERENERKEHCPRPTTQFADSPPLSRPASYDLVITTNYYNKYANDEDTAQLVGVYRRRGGRTATI